MSAGVNGNEEVWRQFGGSHSGQREDETEKLQRMNLVTLRRCKPPSPHEVLVL